MHREITKLIFAFLTVLLLLTYTAGSASLIVIPVFIYFIAKYLAASTEYICPRCSCVFKVSTAAILLSPHQGYHRLLKCQCCGAATWCEVFRFKGKEVKVKRRAIVEKGKTNHRLLLQIIAMLYAAFVAIWLMKPDLLLFAVFSSIYAYFAAVIMYARLQNYHSSIYYTLIYVATLLLVIFALVQVIMVFR